MPQSDVNTMSSPNSQDTEIVKMVLDLGLATPEEVDACREQQKQSSDPNSRSIADYLVESQHITPNQAKRLRQQAQEKKSSSQIPGYEIISKLGSGAMAVVWKARQIKLNRIVAIKFLKKKYQTATSDSDYVDRFYKEGQAAARLSHNNIVQAIDVGSTQKGEHYFVMEYIEGKSLYDVMAPPPTGEGRNFSEAEALDIGIQIGEALAHAHSRGLLHRDVKPKNIILTSEGVAKLTDLGLARDADDVEAAKKEAGRAYGTPYYISPEQIRGELDIDFRTDIYSLGATLYHMVTGRPPYEGDSPTVVMHKHLTEQLIPADHVNTALSAGLGEIIDVAMAKRREERYSSTQAMVEDLKAVRDNKPPTHGRRAIDLDSLAKVEETGKTVDIVPVGGSATTTDIWRSPAVIGLAITAGVSLLCNLIMLAVLMARK